MSYSVEGDPSAAYAYATSRPLPVYPAGCPTPTYMAAAQLYIRPANPVQSNTPSPPPPPPMLEFPPPTPPPPPPSYRAALNLFRRTTLLHYPERLIRNYYLGRSVPATRRGQGPETTEEKRAFESGGSDFDLRASKNCLSEEQGPRERLHRPAAPLRLFRKDPATSSRRAFAIKN